MLDSADSNLAALYARQAAAAVTFNVVKQSLAQQQMKADTTMQDLIIDNQHIQAALNKATLQIQERQAALCVPVYDVHPRTGTRMQLVTAQRSEHFDSAHVEITLTAAHWLQRGAARSRQIVDCADQ
jgi:hypothetical protein